VIDTGARTISVDEFLFLGLPVSTVVGELLEPGTYTRTYVDPLFGSQTRTETIPPDTTGAYIVFEWNSIPIQLFMAWDVSPDERIYTNVPIPGNTIIGGPFNGFTAYIEFQIEKTGPYVDLSISVTGGNVQECAQTGGSMVEIVAVPLLFNGAILDSIVWSLDGEMIGEGLAVNPFVTLGTHTIEAVATTTNGDVDTATQALDVRDTTSPVLDIAFIDNRGNEVDAAGPGPVQVRYTVSDVCDESPVITNGTATRVYNVEDGDFMFINRGSDNLRLPVSAVRVDAAARDSSGNVTSATEVLTIE
jgi:hypothetical protein